MASEVVAAVKALIVRGNRFLVVQDAHDGYWELPGGKVKFNETPHQALVREIKEELGIAVKIGKPVGFCWTTYKNKWIVMTIVQCTTRATTFDTTKNPADEDIDVVRWVTAKEFLTNKYAVHQKNLKEVIASTFSQSP